MGNTLKKILSSASSIIDITGSQTKERYNKISRDCIINGFRNDKRRISGDFNKSIKKLIK